MLVGEFSFVYGNLAIVRIISLSQLSVETQFCTCVKASTSDAPAPFSAQKKVRRQLRTDYFRRRRRRQRELRFAPTGSGADEAAAAAASVRRDDVKAKGRNRRRDGIVGPGTTCYRRHNCEK